MKRASPISRGILTAGAVAMLVGVIALSTASRAPYHAARTPNWHTFKAGRMSESARRGAVRVQQNEPRMNEGVDTAAATASWPEPETPRSLQVASQAHHFRSPPVLS